MGNFLSRSKVKVTRHQNLNTSTEHRNIYFYQVTSISNSSFSVIARTDRHTDRTKNNSLLRRFADTYRTMNGAFCKHLLLSLLTEISFCVENETKQVFPRLHPRGLLPETLLFTTD